MSGRAPGQVCQGEMDVLIIDTFGAVLMRSGSDTDLPESNGHGPNRQTAANCPKEMAEPRPAGGHPFGRVLRTPRVARLIAFWLMAFMPVGMTPLATVLTLREYHYSYLSAGMVLGGYSVGIAVSGPFAGRLMDRIGMSKVLIPCAVAYAIGAGSLIMLATVQTSVVALAVCTLITGAMFPPVYAVLRGLWPSLISSEELRAQAFNLDATLAEISPIVGTLLVVLVANAALPSVALMTSAGFAVVGTVGFVTSNTSRQQRVPRDNRRTPSPFGLAGLRALLLASAAMGGIAGAIDVAAPDFAEFHGARSAAGFALSACALGSLLGGVAFSPRLDNIPLLARYRRLATIQFLAFCLPLLASSNVALVVLFFAAGAPFALAYGTAGSLVSAISPPGARTEAFAMMNSALAAGGSFGAASAGFMGHQGGPVAALGTATFFAGVALVPAIPGLQRRYGLDLVLNNQLTSPAPRSPCSPRSPRTPCRPSPASPTLSKTSATTPAPGPTPATPARCGI